MELPLLVNFQKEKRMEKDFLNGVIHHIMKENFKMKIFMVMVNIIGQMEEFIKDNGLKEEWKEMEHIYMKEKSIKVTKLII